jgi:hypothetical protein
MQIKNLNPSSYKRFFAFGCSFTYYFWPSWADIIGQDIQFYENWGEWGGGNHFIFNSVVEANQRYKFNKDDLVIIMWSTKERQDHYVRDKWEHATATKQLEIYGKKWIEKYVLDNNRGQLVRDLAFIKSTQLLLDSLECDWANLMLHPMTDHDMSLYQGPDLTSEEKRGKWFTCWEDLKRGIIHPTITDKDVIELYLDIFEKIEICYEGIWTLDYLNNRPVVNNRDVHPYPLEALQYLDKIWPANTISTKARNYARFWNDKIFITKEFDKILHDVKKITRC